MVGFLHLEEGCYRYSVIRNGFKGKHVEVGYLLTDGLEQGSWIITVKVRLTDRYT
jgi:hypothetical protein